MSSIIVERELISHLTPLVGNEFVFVEGEEPKQYDKEEIVRGMEKDVENYFADMMQESPVEGQIVKF